MSKENTIEVTLMESFITYENHGSLKINLDDFPEFVDKSREELIDYLNANKSKLFVDTFYNTIVKTDRIKPDREDYTENEWEEMAQTGAHEMEEENPDAIPLYDYWIDTECFFSKIKDERKYLYL